MKNTGMLKYIIGSVLLALNVFYMQCQPVCIAQQYTVKDGLIQSNPSQLLQDHNGFIWVRTWNGLNRFDGREFETFQFPALSNQHIQKLENTMDGNLWMISYDRRNMYMYDTRHNQLHDILKPYEQKFNSPLYFDALYPLTKGVTWVALSGGGGFRILDEECTTPAGIQYVTATEHAEIGKIYNVFEDNRGNEWILSDKGVVLYDKRIISNYPYSMYDTIDNHVFLASGNGRFAYYDIDNHQLNIVPLDESVRKINAIMRLEDHKLAILSDNGLYVYQLPDKAIKKYNLSDPGISASVTKIYQDSQGFIWAFTQSPGIIRLDLKTGIYRHLKTSSEYDSSSPENEPFIYEDPNGTVWTIPLRGIFSYYDEKSQSLKPYFPLGGNVPYSPVIKGSYIDKQNNLWIRSQRSLIKMFFPKSPYTYIGLDDKFDTKSLLVDENDNLWIATKKGSIRIMDAQKQLMGYLSVQGRLVHSEDIFVDSGIYTLLRRKDGTVWIGSKEDGLFKLVPTEKPYQYEVSHYSNNPGDPYSVSNNKISCLYEDQEGRLWVGTFGGGLNLVEEKNGDAKFIHSENKLTGFPINRTGSVRCIMEAPGGQMMVGMVNGLITFSSGFTEYEDIHFYLNTYRPETPNSLPSSDIMNFLQAFDGTIYIYCYGGGLCKLTSSDLLSDKLQFHSFAKHTSQLARAMIEDRDHNIWLCSETDITLFDIQKNSFECFGHTFFHRSFNYSECIPKLDRQGNVLIGTEGGVLLFSPDHLSKQTSEAPIVLTGIKYSEDNRSHILNDVDYLEIPTGLRNFTISFAALDYINSTEIQYAYRLGNDQWYNIGRKNSVSFVNLPAGKYQFQVKATNGDGIWMGTIKTVTIDVLPAFWETEWAKVLYFMAVLIVSLIVGYIFFYIYYLKHKVNMEQKLAEIKVRSFIDISHELRTPLTLIAGPVSEVLSQEPLTDRAQKHLQIVQKNVNRMLLLINQVLDFRKIQTKKMKLTIEHRDVISLLHNIMDNFRLLATEKNIHFGLHTDLSSVYLWLDCDKFEKIIFNLLSNAFKYTSENKSIIISVKEDAKAVAISIKDEGMGIQKDRIPYIFERFTTISKENDMQPSSGIGLSLVNELVKMLHGEIQVESEIKRGSTFTLTLYKGKDMYAQDANIEYILNDHFEKKESSDTLQAANETAQHEPAPEVEEISIRILVVEDNTELRQFICDILSATYHVTEAVDGIMALEQIEREAPDFIITDIMMPRMDGIELIRQIKGNIQLCDIPIIILSAKSSVEDRIRGLQLGIDDYIPKPFSADYLKTRIAGLIRQRETLQSVFFSRFVIRQEQDSANNIEQIAYPESEIVPLDEQFMIKLAEFMDNNYFRSELRVNELAEYMNMSRSVFNRKINGIMGVSPIEYIKRYRLNRAKNLIRGGMPFSEVAFAVGFSDPGYFGKAFKKEFGLTLTEYKSAELP